jgi:hypothetical protein
MLEQSVLFFSFAETADMKFDYAPKIQTYIIIKIQTLCHQSGIQGSKIEIEGKM